ncbi:MAG: hypothetical protein IKI49_06040, partial [Oscillospiraceae bacterium]|nr:hypothetical protein [Oscillospiraceae bacterium]
VSIRGFQRGKKSESSPFGAFFSSIFFCVKENGPCGAMKEKLTLRSENKPIRRNKTIGQIYKRFLLKEEYRYDIIMCHVI